MTTSTRTPRLVRAGVAVALGVALPVAALRTAPASPAPIADAAGGGTAEAAVGGSAPSERPAAAGGLDAGLSVDVPAIAQVAGLVLPQPRGADLAPPSVAVPVDLGTPAAAVAAAAAAQRAVAERQVADVTPAVTVVDDGAPDAAPVPAPPVRHHKHRVPPPPPAPVPPPPVPPPPAPVPPIPDPTGAGTGQGTPQDPSGTGGGSGTGGTTDGGTGGTTTGATGGTTTGTTGSTGSTGDTTTGSTGDPTTGGTDPGTAPDPGSQAVGSATDTRAGSVVSGRSIVASALGGQAGPATKGTHHAGSHHRHHRLSPTGSPRSGAQQASAPQHSHAPATPVTPVADPSSSDGSATSPSSTDAAQNAVMTGSAIVAMTTWTSDSQGGWSS